MGENSKIEWTHHTFNPWRGCTKVSPGCANCYAESLSARNPGALGEWGKTGTRIIASDSMWYQPAKWNREAQAAGDRRRVFCASLADVFEGRQTMPEASWKAVESARLRLFNLIDATPSLDWLLLTKRPENIIRMIPSKWRGGLPANVWIGTSVEDQVTADQRIPELLKVPTRVRFLSMEPLLGPVDFNAIPGPDFPFCTRVNPLLGRLYHDDDGGQWTKSEHIDWVIVGGESGPKARPMHPNWARSIRDKCLEARVPFFFKQWGEWAPGEMSDRAMTRSEDTASLCNGDWIYGRQTPSAMKECHVDYAPELYRSGKAHNGRHLDGRTWDEMPG